jgi:hypothetical protein
MKNKTKPGQIAYNEISSGDFWARCTIEWNGIGMSPIEKGTKAEVNQLLKASGLPLYSIVRAMRGERSND